MKNLYSSLDFTMAILHPPMILNSSAAEPSCTLLNPPEPLPYPPPPHEDCFAATTIQRTTAKPMINNSADPLSQKMSLYQLRLVPNRTMTRFEKPWDEIPNNMKIAS